MPPEHPKKTIEISGSLYQRMEDSKPEYLSTTAFFQLMADQGLGGVDSGITLIKPSAPQAGPRPYGADGFISNKEVIEEKEIKTRKKSPFSTKQLDPEVIPEELQDCADQIIEFWAVKKGTRSEGAATRLFNKLSAMAPGDRIKALNAATDSGWATVFEPKPDAPAQSRHNHQAEPQYKHPAHQVFTAADFQ